ncbi:AGAP010767-PA-like protein [Anopheles sinensis]|uniref:AGAP010767-PA-like protein n=1 Tax=Anopheles sinensis TaxID=74873 RepID=A0A084WUH2_ANOSI|nr:AGAP010767-PA-like protein [Anopheles sinensis]
MEIFPHQINTPRREGTEVQVQGQLRLTRSRSSSVSEGRSPVHNQSSRIPTTQNGSAASPRQHQQSQQTTPQQQQQSQNHQQQQQQHHHHQHHQSPQRPQTLTPTREAAANGSMAMQTLVLTVHKDATGYGMKVSGDKPVFVESVKPGGAARRAGLMPDDMILKVKCHALEEEGNLQRTCNKDRAK